MFYNEDFHENILSIIANIFQFFNKIKSFQSTTRRKLRQQFAACGGLKWQGKFRIEHFRSLKTDLIFLQPRVSE